MYYYIFINLITINSTVILPINLQEPVSPDPDDDKFISCALASRTKLIVSGDKHLLNISGFRGVEVLTPRSFIERYIKIKS